MVIVELNQTQLEVREEDREVTVCLTLDTPIATPLTVQLEAIQATPTSATSKIAITRISFHTFTFTSMACFNNSNNH